MKKLFCLAAVAILSCTVIAAEKSSEKTATLADIINDDNTELTGEDLDFSNVEEQKKRVAPWPAFFAVCEVPATPDLVGLRITFPFATKQESVTGFDVGIWGRTRYFEGFQMSLLRNDVKDQLSGVQFGLYNSAAQADALGAQIGLWNEAGSLRGGQLGFINTVGQMQGVQLGFINRAETLHGFQFGLVNVIRAAEMPFLPIVNIGF